MRKKGVGKKDDIVVNKFFKYKIVENGFLQSSQNAPPVRYSRGGLYHRTVVNGLNGAWDYVPFFLCTWRRRMSVPGKAGNGAKHPI